MGNCCSETYTPAYPDDDPPPSEWRTSAYARAPWKAEAHEFSGEATVSDWKGWFDRQMDRAGEEGLVHWETGVYPPLLTDNAEAPFSGPAFKSAREAVQTHDGLLWDAIVAAGRNLRAGLDTVTIAFASVVGIEDNYRYRWDDPELAHMLDRGRTGRGRCTQQRHDLIFNAYRALLPKYHSAEHLKHHPEICKPLVGPIFELMSAVDEATTKVYEALPGSPMPLRVIETSKSTTVQHLGTAGPDGEEFQVSEGQCRSTEACSTEAFSHALHGGVAFFCCFL